MVGECLSERSCTLQLLGWKWMNDLIQNSSITKRNILFSPPREFSPCPTRNLQTGFRGVCVTTFSDEDENSCAENSECENGEEKTTGWSFAVDVKSGKKGRFPKSGDSSYDVEMHLLLKRFMGKAMRIKTDQWCCLGCVGDLNSRGSKLQVCSLARLSSVGFYLNALLSNSVLHIYSVDLFQ